MWSALSFSPESVFLQVYGALACRTKENVVELFSIYGEYLWVYLPLSGPGDYFKSRTRIPTNSCKPCDPSLYGTLNLFLLSYVLKISHFPKQPHCFLTHRSTLEPWLTNWEGPHMPKDLTHLFFPPPPPSGLPL